jgi:hypothetical protein
LSIDTVHILVPTTDQKTNVGKSFLPPEFESFLNSRALSKANAKVKEVLRQFGITLLEIWHETTLEEKIFPTSPADGSPCPSGMGARVDDTNDPLPDLYHKAVNRCVTRVMDGGPRLPEWDGVGYYGAVEGRS